MCYKNTFTSLTSVSTSVLITPKLMISQKPNYHLKFFNRILIPLDI